jgi:SAM-dependent methyltransferase
VREPPAELVCRVAGEVGDPAKFVWMFKRYVGVEPSDDVLDAGCGVGRAALGLADYLTGRYEGFDIDPEMIRWCQENITAERPSFRFTHVPVFNGAYNEGGIAASELTFPYPDDSFDIVFGLSLFTHLLPEDLERYLSETRRVLRASGRVLFTFFLMRPKSREILQRGGWIAERLLARDQGDYTTLYDQPEELIGYRQGYVREAFERNGFEIKEFFWGTWPEWAVGERPDYTQDSVVAA